MEVKEKVVCMGGGKFLGTVGFFFKTLFSGKCI